MSRRSTIDALMETDTASTSVRTPPWMIATRTGFPSRLQVVDGRGRGPVVQPDTLPLPVGQQELHRGVDVRPEEGRGVHSNQVVGLDVGQRRSRKVSVCYF